MDAIKVPKTLQHAVVLFSDPNRALAYATKLRWPDGVTCPRCQSKENRFVSTRRLWFCKGCKKQFTIKVGTIFEDSAVDIGKWMIAYWMLVNCKNGVSSYELAKAIGVTQKTAWFMLHRLRLAMKTESGSMGGPDGGEVEVDETYVGPTARNLHRRQRILAEVRRNRQRPDERGHYTNKTGVQGILDRETRQIRTTVLKNAKRETLQAGILETVAPGSRVYTDQHVCYDNLRDWGFVHQVVNHLQKYVDGRVHTNGLENYWSLLKRTLRGTYVAVEPFHLERYADEQAFRFNTRKAGDHRLTDAERFELGMSQVSGKRLTFDTLTGKGDNQREVF